MQSLQREGSRRRLIDGETEAGAASLPLTLRAASTPAPPPAAPSAGSHWPPLSTDLDPPSRPLLHQLSHDHHHAVAAQRRRRARVQRLWAVHETARGEQGRAHGAGWREAVWGALGLALLHGWPCVLSLRPPGPLLFGWGQRQDIQSASAPPQLWGDSSAPHLEEGTRGLHSAPLRAVRTPGLQELWAGKMAVQWPWVSGERNPPPTQPVSARCPGPWQ